MQVGYAILICYILFIIRTEASFEFKLKYCQIKCTSECPAEEEEIEEKPENKTKIPGFFWRDYTGTIPEDAFPLGGPDQKPQTYLGYVLDPYKNGTFSAAIVEGRDYVYVARDGTSEKLTKVIMILCSQEPERLRWLRLVDQKLQNVLPVSGGTFVMSTNRRQRFAYAARTESNGVYLVGDILARNDTMEYADLDGSPQTTEIFELLLYDLNYDGNSSTKQETTTEKDQCIVDAKSSFKISMKNIIPKFHKELSIGPCTITCTNIKDDAEKDEIKKPNPSMYYYWSNSYFFAKSERFPVGYNSDNSSRYIGRNFNQYLGFDVGTSSDGKEMEQFGDTALMTGSGYTRFFCTSMPDKLKWVQSNSTEFRSMDKSKVLIGGVLWNQSITYMGRVKDGPILSPSSVRIYNDSIWAWYSYYGSWALQTFEVLTYVD